jgi:hypothetical protein
MDSIVDNAIEDLTKMLIRQDIKDKENNSIEKIVISKVDLIKKSIKLLKLLKKSK